VRRRKLDTDRKVRERERDVSWLEGKCKRRKKVYPKRI
jgi:hypothetical protein